MPSKNIDYNAKTVVDVSGDNSLTETLTSHIEESETVYQPPDRDYDFREGLDFEESWPSRELVEFIHDTMVDFRELSKQEVVALSLWGERQTRKALQFLETYEAVEYHRLGREVVYRYNPDSATNYELFEAMGALNSQEVRYEYLKELRERNKEAHLEKVASD